MAPDGTVRSVVGRYVCNRGNNDGRWVATDNCECWLRALNGNLEVKSVSEDWIVGRVDWLGVTFKKLS